MNCVHFQLAMLAYNLAYALQSGRASDGGGAETYHLGNCGCDSCSWPAKIARPAGDMLVRNSDHYAEQGILTRLMTRLRSIVPGDCFTP
jgi:hypothetical protein